MSLWVNWGDDFTSVPHSIQVEKYTQTIANKVTFTHALTHDLETEGHVMVYVIFVISACICPTAMIVLLFRKDFRSENSFQLSPFAWSPCLTLKLNVTSWSTWHMSFLPVFVLPQWFFFRFVRFLGQGIHSNYCHSHDSYVWLWNSRSCHGLREICYLGTCMCPTAMIFCFVRFSCQGIYYCEFTIVNLLLNLL